MTLPANLGAYLSAILFVLGAYAAALYIGMLVWTYRDIHSRTRDTLAQGLAVLLVAVFTLPGLLVYYLLRPQETLAEEYERSLVEESVLHELGQRLSCPSCQRRVESDFVVCPYCHEQLRLRCTGCGHLLQPEWDVCPYCGLIKSSGKSGMGAGASALEEVTASEDDEASVKVAGAMVAEMDPVVTADLPHEGDFLPEKGPEDPEQEPTDDSV